MLILSQMKEIQVFYFSAVKNNLEFDHDLITEDKYHHLNYIIFVVTRQQAEFTSLKKANKTEFWLIKFCFSFCKLLSAIQLWFYKESTDLKPENTPYILAITVFACIYIGPMCNFDVQRFD